MMSLEVLAQDASQPSDFLALFYFVVAGLATTLIEAFRRWVKHRMDLWADDHPLKTKKEDDDE